MKNYSLILLCLLGLLSSCYEVQCNEDGQPPLVLVDFIKDAQSINPRYDKVYGIDAKDDAGANLEFDEGEDFPGYYLPLSASANQVTYIFEKTGQPNDTLIIEYDQRFSNNFRECFTLQPSQVAVSRQSTLIPLDTTSAYQSIAKINTPYPFDAYHVQVHF